MKKFLFTLAALMMAGSLCATEYFYIDDFEVSQNQLGTEIEVPVKAHFDARVSACEFEINLPEGMEIIEFFEGADSDIDYFTNTGRTKTVTAGYSQIGNKFIVITSATVQGYYQVDGAWESYGALKWEPGDYEEMLILVVDVDANFAGGNVTVISQPSCGQDPRGNTCEKNQINEITHAITVEGGAPVIEDLTGTIEIGDVTEDGMLAINYTGNEDVTIVVTVNGVVAEMQNGMVQLAEGENVVVVTVSAEGYNNLVGTYNVTYTAPVPEQQTAAPSITFVENENEVVVTATGEGTVILYCNGQVVENPCTILKGEEAVTYTFTATAQVEGELISDITTLDVTVPAKPVDPTKPVVYLMMVQHDGKIVPIELTMGDNGEYATTVDVNWPLYWYYGSFYYTINGVPYGAAENETAAEFGYAMANPLTEGTNTYTVPVGYRYSIGLNIIYDENTLETLGYCAYVAQGNPNSVDELSEGKTVAGVRYFNMAGQEMQEANGMTIVVTTYTDGTTSSVKVMK